MSQAKFASITGSLLARKGEAAPWHGPSLKPRVCAETAQEAPAQPLPPPPMRAPKYASSLQLPDINKNAGEKMHKYALHMTERDYEKLGLIAVKRSTTRQQLMQRALADFLAAQGREYRGECACLETCDTGCEGAG